MRMWISSEDPHPRDDPGSPPLEGGEALCEFMLDSPSPDLQQINVLRSLPSLLEETKAACLKDVFPKIQASLPTSQAEVQLEASSSFLTILERELVPTSTFTQTFLQSILTSVDSKDPVVANAWLETLMDMIDLLPQDIVKKDILPLAISKGQHSQPVASRLAGCKILGKICSKFEAFVIKKEILPLVQSLCQDVDYEVRSCIAHQLDIVARGLGLDVAKSAILPWLVELSNDEASYVRLASIATVVNMLSLLDDETCTQTIIPLVKKFCETSLQMEDAALPIAAKQLGRLCHGLSVNLKSEEKHWFLNFYCQLARLGLPTTDHDLPLTSSNKMPDIVPSIDGYDKYVECRQSCAYNLPAMVLFAQPKNFKSQLYDTFCDLVADPHSDVRKTMACGIHEVAKLLGPSAGLIQRQLVMLLEDDCLEVLEGLITNLPTTLEALAREGSMNSENKIDSKPLLLRYRAKWGHYQLQSADNIVTALISCEHAIASTTNWRLHAEFLSKLSCLPRCLRVETVYRTFVPLFFHKLYMTRPIPCRLAAATTLLVFLRSIPSLDQRNDICLRLTEEFCHGYSCHKRMLFISICSIVMDLFSKTFFKMYFFMPLLSLADDPVANVRLRLCTMLPVMKGLVKLPADQNLMHALEAAVRKLMSSERDRDVSAALRNAILELDKTEVMDMSNRISGVYDDKIDLAKEEEEKLLWQLEKMKLSKMTDRERNSERNMTAVNNSKIPSFGRKPAVPKTYTSSLHYTPVDRNSQFAGSSTASSRLYTKPEARSAIPLLKRPTYPSSPALNRKVSPDSPMPSPETVRRAGVPIPPSRIPKSPSSSSSTSDKTRYYTPSSPSPPQSVSPEPPRRYWRQLNSPSPTRVEPKRNYSPSSQRRFDGIPRCPSPPLYDPMDSTDLEMDFCEELVITQLSPDDELPTAPWTGQELRPPTNTHRCNTPPVFNMMERDDHSPGQNFMSPTSSSQYSGMQHTTKTSPVSNSNTGAGASLSPSSNRRPSSGIPRFSQYPRSSSRDGDRSTNFLNTRTELTSSNDISYQRSTAASKRASRPLTQQVTADMVKNAAALTRAKSTSHLSPSFSRKLGPSLIPRASSSTRSPTGRSPSAPTSPRCMSPVRLQPHNVGRQRVGLHLPLNQSRLAGRRFCSRPGSPASLSGESDGQATPDSPCSYGSNDSRSPGSPAHSRLRRFSGGSNQSKIPSLIPRNVTSVTSRKKSVESR